MPFDMSNHSSAKSSIAKDLLKRVANDVKTFAISANRNEEPGIKGFSAKQCEALVDLGSRSGAVSTVKSILKELRNMLRSDRTAARKEIERCVRAANHVDKENPFLLNRMGGQEVRGRVT